MMQFPPSQFGLDLIGMLCVILALLWALAVVVLSLVSRHRISATNRWLISQILVCCGLWLVPYEEWKLLMVRAHGAGHAPKNWIVRAAASGELRLLDYLIANGVDVHTRTQSGESPLGAAAAAGQVEAARFLIARGARLDNRTVITLESPLSEAAQMHHTDMVKLLLDHGANPSAKDVMNRTALEWAQQNGNGEMVRALQAGIPH